MAGFTIPDNDVAGFPLQAQIFELDIEIMAGDAGWVVSGCGVTPQGSPDMTVAVAAGVVRPRGLANVAVAAGNLTVGAADATLWRIDLVSSSSAGVKTITAGTAAASTAVKPPARPSDHVGLAFVLVPPAGTAISGDLITDKRNLSDPGVLRYLDHGNTGSSEGIDFSAADVQRIVLNSATVALSTSGWPASGTPGIVRVYVVQDGTGGRLLSYSAEIDWGDLGAPTLQTGAGKIDVIDLQTIDGGTTVIASVPNRAGATGSAGSNGANGISGGAVSIPYTFSTTTTDADPGNGNLRLSNATQNAATTIRADLLSSDGTDWSAILATLADSSSTVKGHLRIYLTADPTKWLLFTVAAVASPSGYKNITVANVGYSAASPFSNADPITLSFTRTGDQGSATAAAQVLPLDAAAAASVGSGDLFAGTSLDGGWSDMNTAVTTKDRTNANWLVLKNSGTTSGLDRGIKRAFAPAGDFTVYAKIAFATAYENYQWAGIFVGAADPSDTGNRLELNILYANQMAFKFTKSLTGSDTPVWSAAPNDTGYGAGGLAVAGTVSALKFPVWLRLRRSGSNLYAGISYDGVEFIENATGTTIAFTVATCGLLIGEATATQAIAASVNWIATTG